MHRPVRIFVSYSHQDAAYLEPDSLLGFLRGLTGEGVELWTDRELVTGELWDGVIQGKVQECDVALVLVSQAFLDSPYCQDREIRGFLAGRKVLVPLILSPCEWRRHDWLASRQFLPGGDGTVEELYTEPGPRKRLFLKLRQHLREQAERVRTGWAAATTTAPAAEHSPNPFIQTLAIRDPARFIGRRRELARLERLLSGGSVALLGEPKLGKSSLLWRLAEGWKGDVLGPVDFQGVEDLEDLYTYLAAELGVAGEGWRPLRDHLRRRTLLLLLDEMDAAPTRGFDGDALARLRALCGHNPGLKLVVACRNPLKELFPDGGKDSPPYNFLQPCGLGPWSAAEAHELLAHPWAPAAPAFDSATAQQLAALAGGHPFLLQRAAFHRFEVLTDSQYDWRQAWEQDREQML